MKIHQCAAWGGTAHYTAEFDTAAVEPGALQSAAAALANMRSDGKATVIISKASGSPVLASLAARPGYTDIIIEINGEVVQKYTVIPGACDRSLARDILFARVAGSAAAARVASGLGRSTDEEAAESRACIEATVASIITKLPAVFTVSTPASRGVPLAVEVENFVMGLAAAMLSSSEH